MILITTIIVIAIYFYFSPSKIGIGKFVLHNGAYACGDCYPEFKINEVELDDRQYEDILKGELTFVDFTSYMAEEIKIRTEKCAICFNYIVEGSIYKTFNGDYKIKASRLTLQETFSGCCSE